MRRLLPLLTLALLALPGGAAAAGPPKPPALASDAVAMKTLAGAAAKVERCRAKTIDYTLCDSPSELRMPRGVLVDASTSIGYGMTARSRQGRVFRVDRSGGALNATCTPAGRGACGPAGIWKPKPRPVMSPPWGQEWLTHERELVAQLLAIAELIDRCHASSGDFTLCDTPEVRAAADWRVRFDVTLQPQSYSVVGQSFAMTGFAYDRLPDGRVERSCYPYNPVIVGPCAGERW